MRITYKLDKEDYLNFNLHHMKKFPKLRLSLLFQRVLMPIVFGLIGIFFYRSETIKTSIIFLLWLLFSSLWFFLYPKFMKRAIEKQLNKILETDMNSYMLEEKTLELREDGLYEIIKNENGTEEALKSKEIEELEEETDNLYLFLEGEAAYIIPKRFFESEKKLEDFKREVIQLAKK